VLNDSGLDGALTQAVRDAGLERGDLLDKIEKLSRDGRWGSLCAERSLLEARLEGSSTGLWRCALCSGQGYFLDKWCISPAARQRFPPHWGWRAPGRMVAGVLVLGGSVAPILHWGCSLRLGYVLRTRRGGRKQPERV